MCQQGPRPRFQTRQTVNGRGQRLSVPPSSALLKGIHLEAFETCIAGIAQQREQKKQENIGKHSENENWNENRNVAKLFWNYQPFWDENRKCQAHRRRASRPAAAKQPKSRLCRRLNVSLEPFFPNLQHSPFCHILSSVCIWTVLDVSNGHVCTPPGDIKGMGKSLVIHKSQSEAPKAPKVQHDEMETQWRHNESCANGFKLSWTKYEEMKKKPFSSSVILGVLWCPFFHCARKASKSAFVRWKSLNIRKSGCHVADATYNGPPSLCDD